MSATSSTRTATRRSGLLTQRGTTDTFAHVVTFLFGGLLVILTWRRQSYALAIAAALALSPIVWLDFYALAAIPLAVARPRLSPIWILPLVTLGLPSSGIATEPVWGVGRVLIAFGVVFLVASSYEKARTPTGRGSERFQDQRTSTPPT